MKKPKKLSLNKRSLSNLGIVEMGKHVGGDPTKNCVTKPRDCGPHYTQGCSGDTIYLCSCNRNCV